MQPDPKRPERGYAFSALRRLQATLRAWHHRVRTRTELRCLDARGRQDIGLSWETTCHEAAKPFWRA
jgi:uncharacterized protein YjiS (DUF1127 family)